MREIKFRAWDTYRQKMNSLSTNYINNHGDVLTGNFNVIGNHTAGDVILMQFTGLLDKNGNEIFEGDIVEQTVLGSNSEVAARANVQVKYEGCCFTPMSYHSTDYLEVIGNIYENPELLLQKQKAATS